MSPKQCPRRENKNKRKGGKIRKEENLINSCSKHPEPSLPAKRIRTVLVVDHASCYRGDLHSIFFDATFEGLR
jgi:hypothetical protein